MAGSNARPSQAIHGAGCRCLLLVPDARSYPDRLLTILRRRGMDVMVMPDPLAVMEYLVFRDVNMIVIVEASRFRQSVLNELKCALDRYYSQTQLWSYLHKGEDGLPSITHYNGNAPVDQLPLPPVEVEISERIEEFNTSFDSIESDAEGSALLTQEELAMLIGAD